ncbi:MAG: tRNA (adenosine(37)-N6)-threonylcarbamoyltransferase complex ATPase subunit type 1 TsaE [Pseudomonadota bacterium]
MNAAAVQTLSSTSEAETLRLGGELAAQLYGGELVFLSGDLGAGKTTLVRGILRGLGFEGRVKSPSYGLLESYPLQSFTLHHLDLYRLTQPEELFDLGLEELLRPDAVVLIEWPERAEAALPNADWRIRIEGVGESRQFEWTRDASFTNVSK